MGMYQFNVAGDLNGKQYVKLAPERSVGYVFNLCRADRSANMVSWSIQAMATAKVSVTAWISNFLYPPFKVDTEHRDWKVPKLNPTVGGLWVPCESIADFTIKAGENYFQQGDFTDTAQFLMFNFIADYPADSEKLLDARGFPVDEVALSFVVTFR